jgi:peptide/nickel transport system substrate-binding protein
VTTSVRRRAAGVIRAGALTMTCVLLAGCNPFGHNTTPVDTAFSSDINERDPATLADGGDLRLPIAQYPATFNPLDFTNPSQYALFAAAAYPHAFVAQPDGSLVLDTDYFTSAEQTGENPQVITYTINPRAVWTDGSPITWQDLASQVHAQSGAEPGYHIFATVGYDRVRSVTRGDDDRQAVVTFSRPYSEWRGMFSGGGVLLPRMVTETPAAFNEAQRDRPGPSAGPFAVSEIDSEKRRIVFSRNDLWWGRKPRLSTITLVTMEPVDTLAALHDDKIDAAELGTAIQVAAAERIPGMTVRRAPTPLVWIIVFNGSRNSVLADPALRRAITPGIDRRRIIDVTQRGLTDNPVESTNHVFVNGRDGYRDNSGDHVYDPYRARQELDVLGWKLDASGVRKKGDQSLTLTDTFVDSPADDLLNQLLDEMMGDIGVDIVERDVTAEHAAQHPIGYDMMQVQLPIGGGIAPLSTLSVLYRTDAAYNFLSVGTPELDAKIDDVLGQPSDRARETADEIDKMLWEHVHSVPILRVPGNTAVRRDIANFGAFGRADIDYTAIGFTD